MYVDLAGLARYKSDFGAWARGALLPKDAAAARVRTAKAGAVSFVPVQETPLDVSVDFMFSETPPASGDKSPSNPSTISGVSNIEISKITGKNLLPYNFRSVTVKSGNSATAVGVTFSQTNGVYSFSGTATGLANAYITHITEDNILILEPGTYTLSGYTAPANAPTGTDLRIQLNEIREDGSRNMYRTINCIDGSETFTIDRKSLLNVYIRTATGTVYPAGFVCSPQLEFGDTATVYEPSTVDYYTLPLGGTYYGGTLDVASGVMTVTVVKNSFTTPYAVPSDIQDATHVVFQMSSSPVHSVNSDINLACSMFPTSGDGERLYLRGGRGSYAVALKMLKSRLDVSGAIDPSNPTEAEWIAAYNAWAATHDVEFTYTVNTPFTVQLTSTEILSLTQPSDYDPRVNTVYSDAQAVQVGYLKHPLAASADLRNAVVSLGGGV